MSREFAILGLPIENLDLKEAVLKVITLIDIYPIDRRSRYVGTIKVDYLANLYSWIPFKLRNPELLHILEQAALLTADGLPIMWLSSWLGNPLKAHVTGVELISELCKELAKEGRRIYFLGGEEKIIKAAVEKLKAENPSLKIAGVSCPQIDISGLGLEDVQERDSLILEQIHESKPDILVLSLGSPKQEIWYERVHRYLQVPVVIGAGNALSFIADPVNNTPRKMQKFGLQWFYRLMQKPVRLLTYIKDISKFFIFALPLVIYHHINKLVVRLSKKSSSPFPIESFLFLSPKKTLALIPLPLQIEHSVLELLEDEIQQSLQHDVVILDFEKVRYLDLEGLNWLLHVWKIAKSHKKPLLALGINGDLRLLLKMHRVWQFISADFCETPEGVLNRLSYDRNSSDLYESIQQHGHYVIISFFGSLTGSHQYGNYLQRLIPMLSRKDCILDLSYCRLIDNIGFSFLLKLRKVMQDEGTTLSIWGMNKDVQDQFRLARLNKLFAVKEKRLV